MRLRVWLLIPALLGAVASGIYLWADRGRVRSDLAVMLRCPDDPRGRLELAAGGTRIVVDLKSACREGAVLLPAYAGDAAVTVRYLPPSPDAVAELSLAPRRDIAAGPSDYFVVIRIESDPPAVRLDGI